MPIDKRKSKVHTSGGQISLSSAAAPGLAQMRSGGQLEAIGDSMIAESKRLMKAQVEADRASVLANASTNSQFELQQKLAERRNQVTDENGNPLHGSLDQDTQRIGMEVIKENAAKIADPEARRRYVERMTRQVMNERLRSQSIARGQQQSFAVDSLNRNIKGLAEKASVGDNTVVKDSMAELETQTDALVRNGTITPNQASTAKEQLRKSIVRNRITAAVKTNPTNTLRMIEEGTHPTLELLTAEEKQVFKDAASAAAMREHNSRAAEVNKVNKSINNLSKQVNKGTHITDEEIDRYEEEVATIEGHSPKKAEQARKSLDVIRKRKDFVNKFSKVSPQARGEVLGQLKERASSDGQRAYIKRLEKIHKELQKLAKKDPLEYGRRVGLYEEVTPLQFDSSLAESAAQRQKQIETLENHLGRSVSPLTDQEVEAFNQQYNEASDSKQAEMLGNINGAFKEKSLSIYKHLAKKGHARLGYLGYLSTTDRTDVATKIIRGDRILKDKQIKIESKEIDEALIDSMPPMASLKVRKHMSDAIKSVYASKSADANDLVSDELNQERLEASVKEVMGNTSTHNNREIMLPHKMSEAEFKEEISNITSEDIEGLGGMAGVPDAKKAIEAGVLTSIGDGSYLVSVPRRDSETGDVVYRPALTREGKPFILDFNQLDDIRENRNAPEKAAAFEEAKAQAKAIASAVVEDIVVQRTNTSLKSAEEIINKGIQVKELEQVAGPGITKNESSQGAQKISKAVSATNTGSFMQIASKYLGAHEKSHKSTLRNFFVKSTGKDLDPSKVAWCAKFVNSVMESTGIKGTGSLAARSFLKWGTPTNSPQKGDVVVLWRKGRNSQFGHVGFFAGYDSNGNIKILGGNQGDAVSVRTYNRDRLLGFRRPPSADTIKTQVFGE